MPMLHVGADKQAMEKVGELILELVKAPGDQKTIRHAITNLVKVAVVRDTTITHCSFHNHEPQPSARDETGEYENPGDEN